MYKGVNYLKFSEITKAIDELLTATPDEKDLFLNKAQEIKDAVKQFGENYNTMTETELKSKERIEELRTLNQQLFLRTGQAPGETAPEVNPTELLDKIIKEI